MKTNTLLLTSKPTATTRWPRGVNYTHSP